MTLFIFGQHPGRTKEEFVLQLELRSDGQLDTCGMTELFQLSAAGPAERFTPAEFIARLLAVDENLDSYETLDTWQGTNYGAREGEDQP